MIYDDDAAWQRSKGQYCDNVKQDDIRQFAQSGCRWALWKALMWRCTVLSGTEAWLSCCFLDFHKSVAYIIQCKPETMGQPAAGEEARGHCVRLPGLIEALEGLLWNCTPTGGSRSEAEGLKTYFQSLTAILLLSFRAKVNRGRINHPTSSAVFKKGQWNGGYGQLMDHHFIRGPGWSQRFKGNIPTSTKSK